MITDKISQIFAGSSEAIQSTFNTFLSNYIIPIIMNFLPEVDIPSEGLLINPTALSNLIDFNWIETLLKAIGYISTIVGSFVTIMGIIDFFYHDYISKSLFGETSFGGKILTFLWDRYGNKYNRGKGFYLLVNGKEAISSVKLERLIYKYP